MKKKNLGGCTGAHANKGRLCLKRAGAPCWQAEASFSRQQLPPQDAWQKLAGQPAGSTGCTSVEVRPSNVLVTVRRPLEVVSVTTVPGRRAARSAPCTPAPGLPQPQPPTFFCT